MMSGGNNGDQHGGAAAHEEKHCGSSDKESGELHLKQERQHLRKLHFRDAALLIDLAMTCHLVSKLASRVPGGRS
jgi:hypothetical protein